MPVAFHFPLSPSTSNAGLVDDRGHLLIRLWGPSALFADVKGVLQSGSGAAGALVAPLAWLVSLLGATVRLDGDAVFEAPLVALDAVPEAGIFKSIWHWIYLFFAGLFG